MNGYITDNDTDIEKENITILSPNKPQTPRKMSSFNQSPISNSYHNYEEFKALERNFADTLLKNKHLKNEITRLEHELDLKISQFDSHKDKIQFYEQTIKAIQEENSQKHHLLLKEVSTYKTIVLQLENQINELQKPNETNNQEDLNKLLRDYKILENQFELEKNQKLIYLDQVEFLSQKNEELIKMSTSTISSQHDFEITHTNHTMNELTDEEDFIDEDEDDFIDQSSPIKEAKENFRFPPSPDPESRDKRQSLPTQLKRLLLVENSDFVLSSFKLSPGQSHEPVFDNSIIKRYSSTKPNHSRYNSHDIIPIKVEFEKQDKRSISGPEKRNSYIIDEKDEYRNGALFALNGYDEMDLNFSCDSSKRSSMIDDKSTRQEITKLKFELQSLKLHNEKLLSYIGFELQKQKKNIRKLSKKQSFNQPEYSDAKLIANSKDILINKKRVLRAVSINAVTNNLNSIGIKSEPTYLIYDDEGDDRIIKKFASQIFNKQTRNSDESDFEDIDEEEEESSSSSSEEEVGVLNHIKHLVMGKPEKKRKEELVDDGLKFKFLTIALGIIIISFRLTPHSNK